MSNPGNRDISRRDFAKVAAGAGVAGMVMNTKAGAAEKEKVRNRFWNWTHYPGVYDGMFGLPHNSRIHPVAASEYLGTPNIVFVRAFEKPAYPFEEYAKGFKGVKNLQWSITGDSGDTSAEEREQVLKLVESMPNITGLYMDDFFHMTSEGREASMSVDEIKAIRERMNIKGRQLDLGVVAYTKDKFDKRMIPYLKLCDRISLWFWKSDELADLEMNFDRLRDVAGEKRIQMGCYMWDYGVQKPMPLDRMELQCEQGLKWLREGKIADMIFCGAHLCDQKLEAVEWTRDWIAKVGDQPLEG